MPGASSPSPALGLLLALAVGLAPPLAQARVVAAPPTSPAATPPTAPDPAGEPAETDPPLVAPANNVAPTTGIGGRLISADDPEARRAEAELEGTALTREPSADVPARLPPQQRAGWWLMFGAFALASTGGVFAGLAEVQEDRAQRLALTLDADTGARLVYAEVEAEYRDILRTGRRDAAIARGFLAAAGGLLAAGIGLFIAHAVRGRKAGARARLRPASGGLEVRF